MWSIVSYLVLFMFGRLMLIIKGEKESGIKSLYLKYKINKMSPEEKRIQQISEFGHF